MHDISQHFLLLSPVGIGILKAHMKKNQLINIMFALFVVLSPLSASAATSTKLEVSGWIPYWRTATGTADVIGHLNQLTEVNPFVYTVKSDGTLYDSGNLGQDPWTTFIATAKAQKVKVIPTIMWSNGDAIHAMLSNTKSRQKLEANIVALVKANNFDGIDIDFEGKKAETKKYFSLFLQGLYQRMGNKYVMCTIESRTPNDSRYYGMDVPADANVFANDFVAINKYCDRVRIMAYDQQGIDNKLASAAASSSQLYAPVADPAWVTKVVNLTAKTIKKSKIEIGVPTYGYEYDVTAYANNEYLYDILWTFNPRYATELASSYGITSTRNASDEMSFTYVPTSTASTTAPTGSVPAGILPSAALSAAAAASSFATAGNTHTTFRLVDWPDAQSIADKLALAKKLGVRGISIFKLDGGEDPNIWSVLPVQR